MPISDFPTNSYEGLDYSILVLKLVPSLVTVITVTVSLSNCNCIVIDICDPVGSSRARFFHFPPAGSTYKRVGKVCLTFLPN